MGQKTQVVNVEACISDMSPLLSQENQHPNKVKLASDKTTVDGEAEGDADPEYITYVEYFL